MGNELVIPGLELTVPTGQYSTPEAFSAIAKAGDYLPRLQLFGGNSEACKEGKIAIAHFGIVPNKDTIEDIGDRFDAAVFAWRPRAIRLNGDAIDNYYDSKHPEFVKVQEESEVADSGCMYGPEFLLYVPSAQKFALFHMNNKTSRRVAPQLFGYIGKAATIKSRLIKTDKYTWHGPEVLACSTPLSPLPTAEEVTEQLNKFLNPDSSTTETVEAETRAR